MRRFERQVCTAENFDRIRLYESRAALEINSRNIWCRAYLYAGTFSHSVHTHTQRIYILNKMISSTLLVKNTCSHGYPHYMVTFNIKESVCIGLSCGQSVWLWCMRLLIWVINMLDLFKTCFNIPYICSWPIPWCNAGRSQMIIFKTEMAVSSLFCEWHLRKFECTCSNSCIGHLVTEFYVVGHYVSDI